MTAAPLVLVQQPALALNLVQVTQAATAILTPAQQGPPGPAISVNGHTGLVQTLTAADVGAYTAAQAECAALLQALIFG